MAILAEGHQLKRRPTLSALLFGLSLWVKQIGIILPPCYLLELRAQAHAGGMTTKMTAWNNA